MRTEEHDVIDRLSELAREDTTYDSGFIFNTECCRPHPLALQAYTMFMDRNMMKEQNPSVNGMEQDVILRLSMLFGSSDRSGKNGYVASGGTEANIVAFWAAHMANPEKDTIIAPRHAHYSKWKMEKMLGLKVQEIPVSRSYSVDPADIERAIDEHTLGIFATAGTSRLGVIDPIPEISALARKYGLHLHVDAAYGGFLIPFLRMKGYDLPDIGFNAGANSITLDPHKYGMCPLGAGIILFDRKELLDGVSYIADFPPIENRTFQGSRSGGPVAATWAMLEHYGIPGYIDSAESLIRKREYLTDKLSEFDGIGLVTEPKLTALGITYGDDETTEMLWQEMNSRGYKITPDKNPASLRVLVHDHVTYDHIDRLVNALRDSIETIKQKEYSVAANF